MGQRKILHVDMDAFFAAVEIRDNKALEKRPIAIGGSPDSRGVIATANYVARKYGVRSAMPSWKAIQLCPDLEIIFPNFDKYKAESLAILEIFRGYSDLIEPLSLDEAFLDVSETELCHGSATLLAKEIQNKIWKERRLTASVGAAPNKFLAKVASDWLKPKGLFVITPENVEEFVKKLSIEKIYGIGHVTADKLHHLDIFTCEDLQRYELIELQKIVGSRAWDLYQLCRGIDNRPVIADRIRKSLSVEETFDKDLDSVEACLSEVEGLYERLIKRYGKIKSYYRIRKPFVKVKFNDFTVTTVESAHYPLPDIASYKKLIEFGWERKKIPVRLLGIGFTVNMNECIQLTLF